MATKLLGTFKQSYAVIVDVTTKGIRVLCNPTCTKKKGCAGCSLCDEPRSGPTLLCKDGSNHEYAKHQVVTIRRFILNEALAAAILFGIPIGCAIIAAFVFTLITKKPVDTPMPIFFTCLAFMGGFLIVFVLEKIFSLLYPPEIIESNI